MVILTLLFMTDVPSWSDPYPLAWTSAGASAILIIAPICAACAAWEGGRLRRARWFAWPHVRSTTIVVLTILLPTLVVGLLMIVVALLFQIITSGFVFIPDWRVLSMAIIVLFAHVLLGFAMGVRIPIVVSLPMVFLLSFAWIELPNTLDDPLWLRHLSGIWTFCCLVSTNLAPQAWIGALLVAIGMISMASVLLLQRLRLWQALVSVVPLVIGVGVGAYMVQDLDAFPAVARDEGVLVCSTSQPRVCVWPEHETRLEEVAALATEASMAWRQVGVIVPDEFTEGAGGDRGIGSFGFSMETDRYTLFNSLSRSVLPPVANCEGQGSVSPREVQTYLVAWLNSVAGMPAEALVARANAQIRDTIATVQLLPLEEQQIWFERNLIALEQCGVPPQLEPLP
ncbi:MAG: hypothetical protein GFH27_549289n159 [Chloroflexi bacterium AL-W]|nr:hypothetical protein [Chloroflexi bacterium AL-N1]NOK66892.1 hypothetical protein [Chloroflexi bacterium AL-N10]NOK74816.1 hypothetical protein [Chloroflexi bacterium AL-N5]NOK81494.1 hypothetical protein [Chloroflexi bacterium AL-W]NOK88964.1 hypothetical protein [Chloroflexi bacterium AL-N15]